MLPCPSVVRLGRERRRCWVGAVAIGRGAPDICGWPRPDHARGLGQEKDRLGHGDSPDSGSPGISETVKRVFEEHGGGDFLSIPLNQIPADDISHSALTCHVVMGDHLHAPPNAVFMGGTPDKGYLVIYRRALSAGDFVRLWST